MFAMWYLIGLLKVGLYHPDTHPSASHFLCARKAQIDLVSSPPSFSDKVELLKTPADGFVRSDQSR